MKRILYLGYYLKKLNIPLYRKFLDFAAKKSNKNKPELIFDSLSSVLRYKISLLEYFQFGFYNLKNTERKKWAGTGYMYEYQLKMNPKDKRSVLDDKTKFHKNYQKFFVHIVADKEELKHNEGVAESLLRTTSGKLVFKVANGKCGKGVEIKRSAEFSKDKLIAFMEDNEFDLVEEFIIQHKELSGLSPSAVNTVRIITQLNKKDEVEILGCRQRISVNSKVDNMAAGNLAAPIDEQTGIINGVAVYSDITKKEETMHPVSGMPIMGVKIPFWPQIISMVIEAAKLHPENRSIGWDVAVTEKGPGLIEGNHDWCKLLWQLPVKKGLRPLLEKHLIN